MMQHVHIGEATGECLQKVSYKHLLIIAHGHGQQKMELMDLLSVVKELIQEQASFFLLQVTGPVTGPAFRVRKATIGRLFLIRASTTRGASSSIRATAACSATAPLPGTLYARFQMFTK